MEHTCQNCGMKFRKKSLLLRHHREMGHRATYECGECGKKFGRKDNYERHMGRHKDESLHQCKECGQLFSRQDNLQLHIRRYYNQVGRGLKRKSTDENDTRLKRRLTKKDEPARFYDLAVVTERDIPKFKTKSTTYKVTFKELEVRDLPKILETLEKLFKFLIKDLTEFMRPEDLVRMSVQCPELDFPITIPFMKVAQLSAETLLREIERVLQSFEEFVLDSSLEIEITHVDMPNGKGRRENYVDLDRFLSKKQCIIRIQNRDDLCCARALVTAKAQLEKKKEWDSIRKGCKIQEKLARELHQQANVPIHRCGIDEVKMFQKVMEDVQINIVSKEHFNGIIFEGPEAKNKIFLYHNDDHYDVITSMPAFLNRSYYCHLCRKGYDHKEKHRCNNVCSSCHKIHEESEEEWIYCACCNRYFKGQNCYELHVKITVSGNSTCNTYYRCKQCDQTINRKMHKREHACGEVYCRTCKDYFGPDHQCYMIPVSDFETSETDKHEETKNDDERQIYIFFDLECTQEDLVQCSKGFQRGNDGLKCMNCNKSNCGTYEHRPNLCVTHKVCSFCYDKDVTPESKCEKCGQNEMVFAGHNTIDEFCRWLFSGDNNGATVLCHNFKGYDSFPILRYLFDNATIPKIIPSGAKNMSVEVPSCNIRMIDSINFLPTALSELPKMFGLKEMAKGYFPHLYNRKINEGVVLTRLPAIEYYNPDSMTTDPTRASCRKSFLEWYNIHQNDTFDFNAELLKYCRSDVDILRRCCLKFRELFMEITSGENTDGIDPFAQCITIASACNLVFRRKFLQPCTIGIIPAQGYRPHEKHSIKALKWIRYLENDKKIHIQHAWNLGEKKIGEYRVDGYHEDEKGVKTVFEYHGCFWHGCVSCFARHTVNPVNQMTMADLMQRTVEKKHYLESLGYNYVSVWECEFDREISDNIAIKNFIDTVEYVTPLEPRDAFSGGRTEAFKLYHEAEENETINYYDVTSLYPFINKTGKAVIGHPMVLTENFEDVSMYEGLIKCKVFPPKQLHIPVLPTKLNNKLLFTLCRTCAESKQQTKCNHSDEERALIGTWVTDELKMALTKGYVLDEIYEVWHFEDVVQYDPKSKSGGIFTEYINTFLKMKQEASGWPSWCKTEEQKHTYLADYFRTEGIQLDYDKIVKNPGLRALAKLMLNSFWGKFGQRSNLPQIEYVSDPTVYFDLLTSDEQEVSGVNFVSDEVVEMRWKNKNEFEESSGRTNVVLAAYTTAQARLKLYSYLERLDKRVLYADTDSIIFVSKNNEWKPSLGDYLGDLTDEVNGNNITHFVTGGPKNYTYKLEKPDSKGIQTTCKVRGITLNYKNALEINFDTILHMVTSGSNEAVTLTDDHKISRDKENSRIVTKTEKKDYKIVFDKRVISKDYNTLPYGY